LFKPATLLKTFRQSLECIRMSSNFRMNTKIDLIDFRSTLIIALLR